MTTSRSIACGTVTAALLAIMVFAVTQSAAERQPQSSPPAATGEDGTQTTEIATPAPVVDDPGSSPVPFRDPAVAHMVDELARLDEELIRRLEVPPDWRPSPETPLTARPTFPRLTPGQEPASQLVETFKWFESLPNAAPIPEADLAARRVRMGKAGLELLDSECRSGVCRLSFVYSQSSAERLKSQRGGRDSARGRPNWISFTIARADGRFEGHIFMASSPTRGGEK